MWKKVKQQIGDKNWNLHYLDFDLPLWCMDSSRRELLTFCDWLFNGTITINNCYRLSHQYVSPASPVVNNVESVKLPFNWILGTVNLIQIVDFKTWSRMIRGQMKESILDPFQKHFQCVCRYPVRYRVIEVIEPQAYSYLYFFNHWITIHHNLLVKWILLFMSSTQLGSSP